MKNIKNIDVLNIFQIIGKTFKILSERERKLLRQRYGLEDGSPRTLEDLAKEYKVSRERIRQIEQKAIEKINLVLEYEE